MRYELRNHYCQSIQRDESMQDTLYLVATQLLLLLLLLDFLGHVSSLEEPIIDHQLRTLVGFQPFCDYFEFVMCNCFSQQRVINLKSPLF